MRCSVLRDGLLWWNRSPACRMQSTWRRVRDGASKSAPFFARGLVRSHLLVARELEHLFKRAERVLGPRRVALKVPDVVVGHDQHTDCGSGVNVRLFIPRHWRASARPSTAGRRIFESRGEAFGMSEAYVGHARAWCAPWPFFTPWACSSDYDFLFVRAARAGCVAALLGINDFSHRKVGLGGRAAHSAFFPFFFVLPAHACC